MPVAWMTQVSVADADETAAKITKAGRFAVLNDPQGACFSIIKMRPGFRA